MNERPIMLRWGRTFGTNRRKIVTARASKVRSGAVPQLRQVALIDANLRTSQITTGTRYTVCLHHRKSDVTQADLSHRKQESVYFGTDAPGIQTWRLAPPVIM
jgi:hypothetical protein